MTSRERRENAGSCGTSSRQTTGIPGPSTGPPDAIRRSLTCCDSAYYVVRRSKMAGSVNRWRRVKGLEIDVTGQSEAHL